LACSSTWSAWHRKQTAVAGSSAGNSAANICCSSGSHSSFGLEAAAENSAVVVSVVASLGWATAAKALRLVLPLSCSFALACIGAATKLQNTDFVRVGPEVFALEAYWLVLIINHLKMS